MSEQKELNTYYKREKTQAEYDKLIFEMLDIIDNSIVKSGDYVNMCNLLKEIRTSVVTNKVYVVVEQARRERIERIRIMESREEKIMREVKEKKYECDACGSMFVSEKNVKNHQMTAKKCSQIVCERIYTDATHLVVEEKKEEDVINGNKIVKKNALLGKYPRKFIKNIVTIYNTKKFKAKRAKKDEEKNDTKRYMRFENILNYKYWEKLTKWSLLHIRKQYIMRKTLL